MSTVSVEKDLVTANRILANEGFVDAFGHVTARDPEDDDKMIVSAYQSPALVERDDLLRMTLNGEVVDDVDEIYSENVIHRAIYRNRDDVNSVVHGHAQPLIPFTVTDAEIKPVTHGGAPFYGGVPTFDEYDEERGRLIVTEAEGDRMASVLDDKRAQMLEGHGANVVGSSVREATVLALKLMLNAEHQLAAEDAGNPRYYTGPEESLEATVEDTMLKPRTIDRAWDFYADRLP